ncbi:hypothetical protein OH76DRAFT_804418 [Lentinus brumalis]|uniref:Uncharacterized protein n=1 Tax=Lentinus brumalis TaxID=2498619 RepID=A0A371CGU1_9APHY|nr:hypothetical protein OH76DRAFT_804418 [Polyporus brumalis]
MYGGRGSQQIASFRLLREEVRTARSSSQQGGAGPVRWDSRGLTSDTSNCGREIVHNTPKCGRELVYHQLAGAGMQCNWYLLAEESIRKATGSALRRIRANHSASTTANQTLALSREAMESALSESRTLEQRLIRCARMALFFPHPRRLGTLPPDAPEAERRASPVADATRPGAVLPGQDSSCASEATLADSAPRQIWKTRLMPDPTLASSREAIQSVPREARETIVGLRYLPQISASQIPGVLRDARETDPLRGAATARVPYSMTPEST